MTIKQLIGLGPDELERMDDATLRQHCAALLKYVVVADKVSGTVQLDDDEDDEDSQPVPYDELVAKEKRQKQKRKRAERWELEAQRLAEQYGVKVDLPKELKL